MVVGFGFLEPLCGALSCCTESASLVGLVFEDLWWSLKHNLPQLVYPSSATRDPLDSTRADTRVKSGPASRVNSNRSPS